MRVQVFKSHLDERYRGLYHVSSHDGRTVEAVPVDSPEQIARALLPDTQVVAIDEAQFMPSGIVRLATDLAAGGRRGVFARAGSGLCGAAFRPVPQVRAVAGRVGKRAAPRAKC